MSTLQMSPKLDRVVRSNRLLLQSATAAESDTSPRLETPARARLYHLAFAPGGQLLAGGGEDGKAWLWELPSGRRVALPLGPATSIRAVAFAAGGRLLAAAGGNWLRRTGRLVVWDVATGKEWGELWRHDRPITALAVSPDGQRLAAASGDGLLRQWDLVTGGEPVAVAAHDDEILSLAFSADGTRLATGGADRAVKLWGAGLEPLRTFRGHDRVVRGVAFAGADLASGDEWQVILWDTAAGTEVRRLEVPYGGVRGVAVAPGGRTLLTAANPVHGPAEVRWWELRDGTARLFHRHPAALTTLAFSPDGTILAAADVRGAVQLWPGVQGR